jgi:glycerol-1-phosphate dehydrogenase [NAD(P)+]
MSMQAYAVEPVHSLLDEVDPDNELAPCGLRRLVLGSDAVTSLADTVEELLDERAGVRARGARRARVALLVDRSAILRNGEDVKDLVEMQLGQRFDVRRTVLDDGHQELHVVDVVLDAAAAAAAHADAVVALGGGTISDIGKVAVQRARRGAGTPVLVSVQTAASVDGFTDDVSVVLRDGVKRTVPSCWPDGVVADAETIAGAPAAMNRAGFGEMTSMLVAPADWRLAALVGVDESFRPAAVRLLRLVGADIDTWSDGVRHAEPDAVARLARALALRGVVTGVAGTTAVLSGVEHLVSHMLDQYHSQHHLPMGLHGAQVGAASVVAASAWELAFERLSGAGTQVAWDTSAFEPTQARDRVERAFGSLDPTGRVAHECWSDYSKKQRALIRLRPRLDTVLAEWSTHEEKLRSLVTPSAVIAKGLVSAGSVTVFAELEPQVDDALALWAVSNCALMRNRFTVVDLLTALGWWTEADVEEVLEGANRAVSAAHEGTV